MTESTQRATQMRQELDKVILSLQKLRDSGSDESSAGGLPAGNGGSTQSNGCSTYSVHCGTPPQVAQA